MVIIIKNMAQVVINNLKKTSGRKYLLNLQKKAGLLDELLALIEDKSLGYMMEETENEKNIPLAKAEKILR